MRRVLEAIYRFVPFKRQLATVLRRFPVPTRVMRLIRFDGIIKVDVDRDHSFALRTHRSRIANDLFWRGFGRGWEAQSLQVWSRLVPRASVILDIGANLGVYSLAAKSLNPDAKVLAFEPLERMHQMLLENIGLNGFDITAVPLAVSDKSGSATIYDLPRDVLNIASLEPALRSDHSNVLERTVLTTRIDDYLAGAGISRVDLVKIDIEGHEPAALSGFGSLLAQFRPSVLVEVLNDQKAAEVWAVVADLGYTVYSISETSGLSSTPVIARRTRTEPRNFLLCDPGAFEAANLQQLLR